MQSAVFLFYVLDSNTDVNETDKRGWTPLMHAAKSGNYAIAEALVSMGRHVDAARCDRSGHSATDIARFYRHKDVYTLLANFSALIYSVSMPLVLPERGRQLQLRYIHTGTFQSLQ